MGVIPGSRVEARGVTPRGGPGPADVYARHCAAFPDVSEKWQLELQSDGFLFSPFLAE